MRFGNRNPCCLLDAINQARTPIDLIPAIALDGFVDFIQPEFLGVKNPKLRGGSAREVQRGALLLDFERVPVATDLVIDGHPIGAIPFLRGFPMPLVASGILDRPFREDLVSADEYDSRG